MAGYIYTVPQLEQIIRRLIHRELPATDPKRGMSRGCRFGTLVNRLNGAANFAAPFAPVTASRAERKRRSDGGGDSTPP